MANADNSVTVLPSPDVLSEAVASDYVGGAHHQKIKMEWGPDNTATMVDDTVAARMPVMAARRTATVSATVSSGATVSDVVDCRGMDAVAVIIPSGFTGTQIRFQGSVDGTNFFPINDLTNTRVAMTVSASTGYPIWGEIYGWAYLKIDCATAQGSTVLFPLQLRS